MSALPTILVDTREQLPFEFYGHKQRRCTLEAGDYSLHGMRKIVVVERKSMADLYGTLVRKHNFTRFLVELGKLREIKYPFLVVEGSPEDVARGSAYSMANGPLVLDKLVRLYCQYGIQVVFGGTRRGAEMVTLSIFKAAIAMNQ